ncbi:Hypothetical predicted protein [Paramuricea clavata]|uniref:Uncharacterized protein n=1 Tax=Paramuricea clavata TaxID=317549 RepID=A0A7D9D521_PARCT|nr:Hypothetical predicted protein [Paramuricea clavata]
MDEIFDTLLLSYDDGLISDEELLLLQDYLCISPNRHSNFPYRDYNPFDWENLDELTCKVEFRFDKQDIPRLQEALQFPEMISIPHATDCPGSFVHIAQKICLPKNLESYANAIHVKGSPLLTCFGFIDGTVRPICRPSVNQRIAVYNGHKRLHAIKFQSICIPNGLIANLSGPWEGRMNDARILGESGLMQDLRQHAFAPDGTPLCLYGDPAYPLRVHLQQPFRNNAALTEDMRQYNKAMSSVRVSVEWLFGEITKYFKFVDFKQQLKIRLSPIGKIYIVSAILQNSLACLYGNIVSEYFEINPPTLENYFWRADA